MLSILGLCNPTIFDSNYGWTGEFSGKQEKFTFRGYRSSDMKFDEETNQWMITTKLKDSALATTNSTIGYPMGTHYWYFYNDTCYGEDNKVSLKHENSRTNECIICEITFRLQMEYTN